MPRSSSHAQLTFVHSLETVGTRLNYTGDIVIFQDFNLVGTDIGCLCVITGDWTTSERTLTHSQSMKKFSSSFKFTGTAYKYICTFTGYSQLGDISTTAVILPVCITTASQTLQMNANIKTTQSHSVTVSHTVLCRWHRRMHFWVSLLTFTHTKCSHRAHTSQQIQFWVCRRLSEVNCVAADTFTCCRLANT